FSTIWRRKPTGLAACGRTWQLPTIIAMYFAPAGSRTGLRSRRLTAKRSVSRRAPTIQPAAQMAAPAKEIPQRVLRPADGRTERTDKLQLGLPARLARWPAAKPPASPALSPARDRREPSPRVRWRAI